MKKETIMRKSRQSLRKTNKELSSDIEREAEINQMTLIERNQILRIELERMIKNDPSFLAKLWFVIKNIPRGIDILYKIVKLYGKIKMALTKNKVTNYAGIITGILTVAWLVLPLFNVELSPEIKDSVHTALITLVGVIITIIGWFTGKDNDGTSPDAK